jgi:hypothetical protein
MLVISLIFTNAIHQNKTKKRPLNKFLKDYIDQLSIEEDQELLAKLDYYLDLYSIYNLEIENKLTDEIILERNNYSKKEILYELLVNSSILPEYQNKKQFSEEMLKFIPRLEKSINKFLLERRTVIFPPINARRLL